MLFLKLLLKAPHHSPGFYAASLTAMPVFRPFWPRPPSLRLRAVFQRLPLSAPAFHPAFRGLLSAAWLDASPPPRYLQKERDISFHKKLAISQAFFGYSPLVLDKSGLMLPPLENSPLWKMPFKRKAGRFDALHNAAAHSQKRAYFIKLRQQRGKL